MSKWDKLINRILLMPDDVRFSELKTYWNHMDII